MKRIKATKPVKPIQVVQPDEPIPAKILAKAIRDLGDGIRAMNRAGLSERAQVLLLHDASGVGKPDIRRVLDAMQHLERLYLKDH